MNDTETRTGEEHERQLRDMNDALLVSSVRQHELAEQAHKAEVELRETQQRLEFTLETVQGGPWDLDLRTGKAQCSFRHDQCFGATEPIPDWTYETFLAYVHPDDRANENRKFHAAVATGQDWSIDCRVVWPDGTVHWIESSGRNYRYVRGKPTRMLGLVRDVTERKQAEEERSRLLKQTQEQAAALADLHRRKDEFLAMLSHELRNPLAPIANAVQLLRLQRGSESPIEQQARTIIERQVGQLRHLIDDLLEVSRITTGRVQLRQERVAASGIVERAVETANPFIQQRRHELTVSLPSEPIWLNGDAARLEQVVVNLLTNAAKYTTEGGRIWLSVELASRERERPEECVMRVRDTGVGIPPDLLPRIFDLFTQAERSLDRSEGGLGIGLCLVQRLVELHGGTVEVYSALGHGSEFVVRLPVTSVPPPSPASAAETTPPTHSLRVLVVDDNVDAAETLAMLLRMSRHDARTAHDGPSALEAAIDYRPDAVLLDIGLPGLNGYEVAKRLREQPALETIVLVAMTGYGQEADRQRSLDAGFDHHLTKPADFAAVQKILATVSGEGKPDA